MEDFQKFKESLKGKKVLVWGIGISGGGVNVARFFAENGAEVLATDMKTKDQLQDSIDALKEYSNITYRLGEHKKEDFDWADIIMRNPAIPPTNELLLYAYSNNKIVETELSIFLKYCTGYTIGITGTRGKSTTTALLTHILMQGTKRVVDGGNNRKSLIMQLDEITSEDLVVMEVSSFMCDSLNRAEISPRMALLTNIYPDHLNWHPSMQHYIDSKGALARFQTEKDIAVLNVDNKEVNENYTNLGNSIKVLVGKTGTDFVIESNQIKSSSGAIFKITNSSLDGEHNIYNAAMAIAAASQLGFSAQVIQDAIDSYQGLEYRQQLIGVKNGVSYINDSTATMPQATIVCLQRFLPKGKVHLILGGVDKNLDIQPMLDLLEKCETIQMFEGSFYDKLISIASDNLKSKLKGPFNSMQKAIESAKSMSTSGDYIILSPSAASFNLFKNEFDRAEQFDAIVKSMPN